jgi:hypothetical protein
MIEKLQQGDERWGRSSVHRVQCLTYAVARSLTGTLASRVILAEDRDKAPYNLRVRNSHYAAAFRHIVAEQLREMRREGHWKLVKVDGLFELERV